MGILVSITGPSASGKSTLESALVRNHGFSKVISTTTRTPRVGEISGEQYGFWSNDAFNEAASDGLFAEKVEFNGNQYGVLKTEFERVFDQGKPVVIVAEPTGVRQLHSWAERSGHSMLRMFIGGDTAALVKRFIQREVSSAPCSEDVNWEQMHVRLKSLVGVEAKWVEQNIWDFVADRYDEKSESQIQDWIAQWVSLKKQAIAAAL